MPKLGVSLAGFMMRRWFLRGLLAGLAPSLPLVYTYLAWPGVNQTLLTNPSSYTNSYLYLSS